MKAPELIKIDRRRTASGHAYTVEQYIVDVPVSDAMAVAYRPDECMRACKACPNYGNVWTCPPFDDQRKDTNPQNFATLQLHIARIKPTGGPYALDKYEEFFTPVKRRMMDSIDLVADAKAVYSFAGRCEYCKVCTRRAGGVCRHPDRAHPSLEGVGFDVNALLVNFAGMEIEWGTDGNLPRVLTFVAAIAC